MTLNGVHSFIATCSDVCTVWKVCTVVIIVLHTQYNHAFILLYTVNVKVILVHIHMLQGDLVLNLVPSSPEVFLQR